MKSGNYDLETLYAYRTGGLFEASIDGFTYYTCTPTSKDEKVIREVGLAFYNKELCHILVNLKAMATMIDDLTKSFSEKYSIDMTCHKTGELYSASRGNTKVSIQGYGYATQMDYYNMAIQNKIKLATETKDANNAKKTIDAL